MTRYFYDEQEGTLIAFDPDKGDLRELEHVGDLEEEIEEEAENETPTPGPGRGKRKCGLCGKAGHSKRTCKAEISGTRYASGGRKPMQRPPCDECGSKGTRHFKDCSKSGKERSMTGNDAWAALDTEVSRPVNRMPRDKFERVKLAQSHDIPADSIARELGLTIGQVNEAILSKTYDDYQ